MLLDNDFLVIKTIIIVIINGQLAADSLQRTAKSLQPTADSAIV